MRDNIIAKVGVCRVALEYSSVQYFRAGSSPSQKDIRDKNFTTSTRTIARKSRYVRCDAKISIDSILNNHFKQIFNRQHIASIR